MLLLKHYANCALEDARCQKDYTRFQTLDFDPDELLQLKEMNKKELTGLMIYCGIHVLNGVPLLVMEENEMRMGYLAFRKIQLQDKLDKEELKRERGAKWISLMQELLSKN